MFLLYIMSLRYHVMLLWHHTCCVTMTSYYVMLPCYVTVKSCYVTVTSCYYDILLCYYEILLCHYDIMLCYCDITLCYYDMLLWHYVMLLWYVTITSCYVTAIYYVAMTNFLMPPHVHIDFVVPAPVFGQSVTDFWGWGIHRAQLRCPDDVSDDMYEGGEPGGALNLNSTNYPDHGRYGDFPLQGKIPTAETGIEPGTSWPVVISSDHQARRLVAMTSCYYTVLCYVTTISCYATVTFCYVAMTH
jgi:hypothetical protein